ncbi:MAG: MBL fold metallo-hydrolase [Candidatus Hadarchaeales archaeon]
MDKANGLPLLYRMLRGEVFVSSVIFRPVWFDSMGAKSSCTIVETPEVKVLIDPGAAIMQPGFPASWAKKIYWLAKAELAVKRAAKGADVVVISHYHYDHFTDFDGSIYKNRLVLTKNPNEYINDSQRKRAESFFTTFAKELGRMELKMEEREAKEFPDPLEEIPIAARKSFGDYMKRRRELFRKGSRWLEGRVRRWNSSGWIPEMRFGKTRVEFPEGKTYRFGRTKISFSRPFFHGVEFSRVGWVFSTIVERGDEKIIHSSDLNGPVIEDYAEWIIEQAPTVLILDGPMTYMMGYLVTRTTLGRAIENAVRILRETQLELLVYDHHLPREPNFRKHAQKVWEEGKKLHKKVMTAAEVLGKKPVVEIS